MHGRRAAKLLQALILTHLLIAVGCSSSPRHTSRSDWEAHRKSLPRHYELIVKVADHVIFTWDEHDQLVSDLEPVTSYLAAMGQDGRLFSMYPRLTSDYRDLNGDVAQGFRPSATRGSEDRLVRYFRIIIDSADQVPVIGDSINSFDEVELAYLRPRIRPSTTDTTPFCAASNHERTDQTYLRSVEEFGIESDYAISSVPGADGSIGEDDAVDLMLIDYTIFEDHIELVDRVQIEGESEVVFREEQHGTNAMGVLAALPESGSSDGEGYRGIAYGARFHFSPAVFIGDGLNCPVTITDTENSIGNDLSLDCALDRAYQELDSGDVLLIAMADVTYDGCSYYRTLPDGTTKTDTEFIVPVNASSSYREMLQLISTKGIAVVLSAGNGQLDLTNTQYPPPLVSGADQPQCYYDPGEVSFPWAVDPTSGSSSDNTTILVGAGVALEEGPYQKSLHSNYGERVDCQGWGDSVSTLAFRVQPAGPGGCTSTPCPLESCWVHGFGMTSAAASMVAGIVASLQGARMTAELPALSPRELRMILKDLANGTPQSLVDADSYPIGPRPDLKNLFASDFFPAELYLRDSLEDDEELTPTVMQARFRARDFVSPDLILMPVSLQVVGEVTSTLHESFDEDPFYVSRSKEAEAAVVRLRNRGDFPGRAEVHLYRTSATPLAPPDDWSHVGRADFRWVAPHGLAQAIATTQLGPAAQSRPYSSWVMVTIPWRSEEAIENVEGLGKGIVEYQRKRSNLRFRNQERVLLSTSMGSPGMLATKFFNLRVHDFSPPGGGQALEILHDLPQGSLLEMETGGQTLTIHLDSAQTSPTGGLPPTAPFSGSVAPRPGGGIRISGFQIAGGGHVDLRLRLFVPGGAEIENFRVHFDQSLDEPTSARETRIGRMTYIIHRAVPDPS